VEEMAAKAKRVPDLAEITTLNTYKLGAFEELRQ